MDMYPRFSIEELVEIEADARNGYLALADPSHYLSVLIDVSRAYRSLLEKRIHGN